MMKTEAGAITTAREFAVESGVPPDVAGERLAAWNFARNAGDSGTFRALCRFARFFRRAGRRGSTAGGTPAATVIALALFCGAQATAQNPPAAAPRVFLLDAKQLRATKERLRAGDTNFTAALAELERDARAQLKARPPSVMDKSPTPPSGDKHDYMSQAPYFWPNPNTSNGLPYIRRDGERNPEISQIPDHGNILGLPEKVETLALAFYFTGDESYAAKAAEFLRVWFLNPDTRMNPNFQYAQAVPGVNTGRGIGLIESRGLTHVVDAVGLLVGSKSWTAADQRGLEEWFAKFLLWMRESQNGRDEAAAKNNHGTYYDIQVASFALFLGQRELATNILQTARQKRIAAQVEPDGRQPLELARTRAWSYSVANLSGLMLLARLGENVGVDLWNFQTPDGRSLHQALDYLAPFALGEAKWPHQQLGVFSGSALYQLIRTAAEKFPEQKYRAMLAKIPATGADSRLNLTRPKSGKAEEVNE